MTSRTLLSALGASLLLSTGSNAQEELLPDNNVPNPQFDFLRGGVTRTGEMDLDSGPGDLTVTRYDFRAILSRPISLLEGLTMVPMFNYEVTTLDFSGTSGFPIHDEGLHSASLSAFFIQNFNDSPWFAVAWTRAELATDYQGISSDSFTFDTALGLFYKINPCFTLGLGFTVTNLNGDSEIFPGINFDWAPTENFRIGIYGPNAVATYRMNDNWNISLEGQPGGGNWNISDDLGQSRTIQLDSYWVGLDTHHRISGEFWISAGLGYTFGNEIEIRDNRGGNSAGSEMEGAPLARVTLRLREW